MDESGISTLITLKEGSSGSMSLLVSQARRLFGYGILEGSSAGTASASVVGGAMSVNIESSNEGHSPSGKLSFSFDCHCSHHILRVSLAKHLHGIVYNTYIMCWPVSSRPGADHRFLQEMYKLLSAISSCFSSVTAARQLHHFKYCKFIIDLSR